MAGFAPPSFFVFRFCCCAFSFLVIFTKQGPLSRSWKHLSNADSSSSFSPSFCFLPVRFLFPPLPSCACCVTYAPLPLGSTPSVLPRDQGPVVALWRGWEKSLEPHSKEKKSTGLWEEGYHLAMEGLGDFLLIFPWEDAVEVLGWHQRSWGTGRFKEVDVALMSHQASYVKKIPESWKSFSCVTKQSG